jgi:hypothetical protein
MAEALGSEETMRRIELFLAQKAADQYGFRQSINIPYKGEPDMGGTLTFDDLAKERTLQHYIDDYDSLKENRDMNTYEKTVIRNYMNIEYGTGASIEQLTMGYGYFGATIDRIKAGGFEVPKDLQTAFESCERDLNYKLRTDRLKQIETLKLRRETLLSADEKRKNIEAEIAKLEELVK